MKLKTILSKVFIITFVLSFVSMLGLVTTKVNASTETKTTIVNKIDETLENNKTYILNGYKYTYTSFNNRLTAAIVDNSSTVKLVVFYDKINGKQTFYPSSLDLSGYTSLEDIIVHSCLNFRNYFTGKTIKNLYIAGQNQITSDFAGIQFTNYHFVSFYNGLYTDLTYLDTSSFNNMQVTNCYYYDFNKHFFKALADKYNASSGATHNFTLKSDSDLLYTKESFYPFEGFEPYLEKCGVKYYHKTNSSVLPDNPTNENFPYIAYQIDERVKSITAPLLSNATLIKDLTFDTLDIRGYSLGSMSDLKGDTIIATNSMSIFSTQYIRFKNIYFVYDPNGSDITSVSTTGLMTLEKIYIPEAHKAKFSEITNNSTLSGKVLYYTNQIKTDFVFTNDNGTKTYKSSNDFIDINTTLNSIKILENSGVTIPTDGYINEFLDSYQLPTEEDETPVTASKYELARFFVFTENIDIAKAIGELKPYMLYKNGKPTTEKYTLEFEILDDNKLELTGKFPDGKEFSFTVPYKEIESVVGEFSGVDKLGNGDFTLIVEARTIKEGIAAKDLMNIFIGNVRSSASKPTFKLPVTLTKAGVSDREASKYTNQNAEEVTAYAQVIITKKDLNKEGFKDPFYTIKDEFGSASLLDRFMDKMEDNPSLKWASAGISTILGLVILYFIYVLSKKTYKWLKN